MAAVRSFHSGYNRLVCCSAKQTACNEPLQEALSVLVGLHVRYLMHVMTDWPMVYATREPQSFLSSKLQR